MRKNNLTQPGLRELKLRIKTLMAGELALAEKFSEVMSLLADHIAARRAAVLANPFNNAYDEIYFYKFEKPEVCGLRLYYGMLFSVMNRKPAGPKGVLRAYFQAELEIIGRFLQEYYLLYQYFRSGFTGLDEQLFIRGAQLNFMVIPDLQDADPDFSTPGDYLFSRFVAFELLQDHLLGELKQLDNEEVLRASGALTAPPVMEWSGKIVNLVELGYALWLCGDIGGGKVTLQKIMDWLGGSFGLEIGIPANHFRDIRRRKRLNRTKFLDDLRNFLNGYMDDADGLTPDDE